MMLAGFDIGGTKCAVVLGQLNQTGEMDILSKTRFLTPGTPMATIQRLGDELAGMLSSREGSLSAIGISCGGPLNSRLGRILSPPNLPGWDDIDIITPFQDRFHVPVAVQNDANACALAEWKWGAGKGASNLVFLTFGTGMGAGLILDGRLYAGTTDLAGEVGHLRLAPDGPVGFGKAGSFEGFCSGGGIARYAAAKVQKWHKAGLAPSFCRTPQAVSQLTAEVLGHAAQAGDSFAIEIWREVGERLGSGLALIVDMLNPELIVIGSIYGRQRQFLEGPALAQLERESISLSRAVCRVVPAGLGERVGDFAALSVAAYFLSQ